MRGLKNGRLGATLALFFAVVVADDSGAVKKVYSPTNEYRELELEARGNYNFDDDDKPSGLTTQKYAVGYGFTQRLFLELYGEVEKEASGEFEVEALELEARYQLFEQGHYWLDAGLYGSYEYRLERGQGPDKIEAKLLLEKPMLRFTHRANVIFESEVGTNASNDIETGLAWSSRYRMRQSFEPGFELHSTFGAIDDFSPVDTQTHLIGPVVYGKLGSFKYDIGYLFGATDVSPRGMLKWILEYEVRF